MALTGSYVDGSEAETYFEDDPRATDFLEADALEWYLKRATKSIDALHLRGIRYEVPYIENGVQVDADNDGLAQTLAFPRIIDGIICDYDFGTQLPIIPDQVKNACCEEALAIYLFQADTDRIERETLRGDGVKAYSLGGDYSETMEPSNKARQGGLISSEAWRIMRKFIGVVVR